ncbi:ATP-binding protein [Psychrilyobacter sp.]|uniref:AAA family ATPase n=1 Tax=Psychrilyobacter sp. TaxID=2586924 RepID=UPI00301A91DF
MFKEFKFGNFRSFKEKQVLSLEAMGQKRPELDCFNIQEIGKDKILKTSVIYGHNSFGKSNIFKALSMMQRIIKQCTNPDYKIDVDNFKLDKESKGLPSIFELTFINNSITYRYGFEILEDKIIRESLHKKNVREVAIFQRESSENSSIELNTSYNSLKKYIKFTRENELFLSSMIKNNETDEIKDIYDWILNNIKVFSADRISSATTSRLFLDEKLKKRKILEALQNANLGIESIEITEEEKDFNDIPNFIKELIEKELKGKEDSEKKFFKTEEVFQHNIYDGNEKKIDTINFELYDKESEGTIKLYSIIGPVLDALENGHTLFIDELDSKLHHSITKYIVDLFHDLSINTENAQLIFNTHDFYLLKEDIFRKDQIYFANKNKFGESSLYSLGDFKGIDKKSNVLAHYLAGNFGAVGNIKIGG